MVCAENWLKILKKLLKLFSFHPSKKLLSFEFAQSFRFQIRASRYIRDSFGHPSKKLLSFDFAQSFCSEFLVSQYTTGHNRTTE